MLCVSHFTCNYNDENTDLKRMDWVWRRWHLTEIHPTTERPLTRPEGRKMGPTEIFLQWLQIHGKLDRICVCALLGIF